MIEYISGVIDSKGPTHVVIHAGWIGYKLIVPLSTSENLPARSVKVKLLTHHYIREDREDLYGFLTESERTMFALLLGVSGIGPKISIAALSCLSVGELVDAIAGGRSDVLVRINGVGKKTAERLVLELRDRIEGVGIDLANMPASVGIRQDALSALEALGLSRKKAEQMIRKVLQSHPDVDTAEELVRLAFMV